MPATFSDLAVALDDTAAPFCDVAASSWGFDLKYITRKGVTIGQEVAAEWVEGAAMDQGVAAGPREPPAGTLAVAAAAQKGAAIGEKGADMPQQWVGMFREGTARPGAGKTTVKRGMADREEVGFFLNGGVVGCNSAVAQGWLRPHSLPPARGTDGMTERGCVEDQPQQVRGPARQRLVEDDTAALR